MISRYGKLWMDRIGEVYCELTVLEYLGNGKCSFKCSCGKVRSTLYHDVVKGKVKSCGHLLLERELRGMEGLKFGKLTAIKDLGKIDTHSYYIFKCDCGNQVTRMMKEVKRGKTSSCGCAIIEAVKKANTKHGMTKTRIYQTHKSMIARCGNSNSTAYKDYGGRGIKVCDEWKDKENGFETFYCWAMKNGYDEKLSIERVDVNGNYEPSNCKWITMLEQQNNRRITISYTYNGETKTLSEWCRYLDLNYDSIWKRLYKYEYSFEKAITYKIHRISDNIQII